MNLPRHLREHHSLPDHLARAIVSLFRLRKNYQWQSKITGTKKKDLHHLKICPIPNCFAVTKRMDHHLKTKKHNLTSKSKMFYQYLKLAKVFDPNVLPDIIEYSPGIFLIESLKNDMPTLPIAQVTDESSNSSSLYNLNMAPATPEKRVTNANVEKFKSCHSPEEIESGFTGYIPELIKNEQVIQRKTLSTEKVKENGYKKEKLRPRTVERQFFEQLDPNSYDDVDKDPSYKPSPRTAYKYLDTPREHKLLLEKFELFLNSPDCGTREGIEQIVAEVRQLLVVTNPEPLSSLFKGTLVRDEFIQNFCKTVSVRGKKGYAAKTIQKHLLSFQYFCTFLIIDRDSIQVDVGDVEEILKMKLRVQNWRKTFNNPAREQYWARIDEELDILVTPEQKQKYNESPNAIQAQALFKEFKIKQKRFITQSEFVSLRDHILINLHFSSGHRSGVTANATMQEYKSALMHKKRENADHLIIRVRNHKTFATAGPALLVLDTEASEMLKVFVESFRSHTPCLAHNIFVSWAGNALAPGSVSRQIHSQWVKAGLFDENWSRNLSCNIIRKSVTTANREENVGEPQEVADLMAHSLETAGKVYHMREKMKTAAKATATIKNHFDKRKRTGETNETPPDPVKKERKRWCSDETAIIKTTFNNEIRTGNISYQQVKEKCSSINVNASPQQLYQKVKNISRTPETRLNVDNTKVSLNNLKLYFNSHCRVWKIIASACCF